MKKLIMIVFAAAAIALPSLAQTNTPPAPSSIPILDILTTGSNYFAVPFGTIATSGNTAGGGIALGYRATSALAPILRLDDFAGKIYLCNLSLELSVPRYLMGKVPFVPFAIAGAGIPLNSSTVDGNLTISAGQPVGIVGAGAYVPLDWVGKGWFWQHSFLVGDYEHWTGAGLPLSQQNQARFGLGVTF